MAKTADVVFEEEIKGSISNALHQAGWNHFAQPIIEAAYKYVADKANAQDSKGINVGVRNGEFTVSIYVDDGSDDPVLDGHDVSIFSLLTQHSAYAEDIPAYERLITDLQSHVEALKLAKS